MQIFVIVIIIVATCFILSRVNKVNSTNESLVVGGKSLFDKLAENTIPSENAVCVVNGVFNSTFTGDFCDEMPTMTAGVATYNGTSDTPIKDG